MAGEEELENAAWMCRELSTRGEAMKIKLLAKQTFPADRGWSRAVVVTRTRNVSTYRVTVKRETPLWRYRGSVHGPHAAAYVPLLIWSGPVPGNIGARGLLERAGVVPHKEQTI